MEMNTKAEDLDFRWPLEAIDLGYVRKAGDTWELRDFFGDLIFSGDRSSCFFKAFEVECQIRMLN